MAITVQAAEREEADAYRGVMGRTFGFDPNEKTIDRFHSIWEADRSRCAYDDGKMVATLGTFSLQLAIPGAVIPAGGTTMVSVLPTHRRRGILRSLMASHLEDVSDHGEAIAVLWASESSIYGRFGFGPASTSVDIKGPTAYSRFHRLAPAPAPVELITAEEAKVVIPPIHDKIRGTWPGMYARSEKWWAGRWFLDPESERDGATSLRYGVSANGDGYVIYRQKEGWTDSDFASEVAVRDLIAETPESWAGLWSLVLNHDLTRDVSANQRSVDDPLFDFLANPRRFSRRPGDGIWVRLQDPVAALSARRYSIEGEVVIEARDPMTDSVYTVALAGGPDGATCEATDRPPQIVLDAEDLGSAYLGMPRFRSLARSGRVGGDHQALALADAMFGWNPLPWCPEIF